MKILFMCVANSARSQLAEGLAKKIFGDKVIVESAGSSPSKVNPYAIEVLKEIEIDISKNWSKTCEQLGPHFLADLNYIITLCAEEVCPVLISNTAKKLHWPFPDPVTKEQLPREEMLKRFQSTRDAIKEKIIQFKNEIMK